VRAVVTCSASERLISSWHAIAFYTQQPPNSALVRGVRATSAVHGRRVEVRARSTMAVQAVRAVVQVGAVCGGGS
jgi:hypothetical protein